MRTSPPAETVSGKIVIRVTVLVRVWLVRVLPVVLL